MRSPGEQMAQRIAEWRTGVYVRVHGNVSDFDDNWRILAYNIRIITDFNEVGEGSQGILCTVHNVYSKSGAWCKLLSEMWFSATYR